MMQLCFKSIKLFNKSFIFAFHFCQVDPIHRLNFSAFEFAIDNW